MVPERMLAVPHEDSDVVGWGGAVFSHPMDLQEVGPSIAQLLQGGGKFKVAGPITGIREALGLAQSAEVEATGVIQDITAWPLALNSLGIGIAPLADTKFNSAKSWLKMAEYAAVGVPCIASPRPEYTRLHKLGVGLLAKNPTEWKKRMQQLRGSADLRESLSLKGRKTMESLTIEANAWRWWESWQEAFKIERSRYKNPLGSAVS